MLPHLSAAKRQLSLDLNCDPGDFDRYAITVTEPCARPGRRAFTPSPLEMATFGKGAVVCADPELLARAGGARGADGVECFMMEQQARLGAALAQIGYVFYEPASYFLPAHTKIERATPPPGYALRCWTEKEIPISLYEQPGCRNALGSPDSPRPDVFVAGAYRGDELVALSGASRDSAALWQVGIDVRPAHRGLGLAVLLVREVAAYALDQGAVPYYGTTQANIGSQRVALASGFAPAWTASFCKSAHTADADS